MGSGKILLCRLLVQAAVIQKNAVTFMLCYGIFVCGAIRNLHQKRHCIIVPTILYNTHHHPLVSI